MWQKLAVLTCLYLSVYCEESSPEVSSFDDDEDQDYDYYYKDDYYVGGPCFEGNFTGTCKLRDECEYAVKLIDEDGTKAPECFYQNGEHIVCCPDKDLLHNTGVFKIYFDDSSFKMASNVMCYYDGRQPAVCCPNGEAKIKQKEAEEPEKCPELSRFKVPKQYKKDEHIKIAWKECASYQRYVKMCISTDSDPEQYERVDTCNIPTDEFRITNGMKAMDNEFPHMAVIGVHNRNPAFDADILWIGGGSLISDQFILTAAHVLGAQHGVVKYALLGVTNKTDVLNGYLANIVKIYPHDLYYELNYDIALLKLDRKVPFSEFIRPACLPLEAAGDTEYIAAGWGLTADLGNSSQFLMKVHLKEENGSECEKMGFNWDPKRMICARGFEIGSDTCQGDSGGPLMTVSEGADLYCNYVINGVVSRGKKCGAGVAIYTKVDFFIEWIVHTVWPEQLSEST
ncbi:unnamed protein product [Leptidea sinapis]|uniref:Peptidase S1 domain-containing protein n=2 Tax=Leptidea sinapis TaxID=189913 RepID=A0A5E4QJ62_9NEOP|nr:unnamed protein product [Leptidea sinapis]